MLVNRHCEMFGICIDIVVTSGEFCLCIAHVSQKSAFVCVKVFMAGLSDLGVNMVTNIPSTLQSRARSISQQ